MPTLVIHEFSCIDYLEFELAPVTIIIGPQGSGKSVTTKLFYFFTDIIDQHFNFAERGESEEAFKKHLCKSFSQWFPASAWGDSRFNISYVAADFSARILRRMSGGKVADEVTISFSEWFSARYQKSKRAFEEAKKLSIDEDRANYARTIETTYRVRDEIAEVIRKKLKQEYIQAQTFIPAGRAFFTSLGRFVAGFEGSGHLDPVTLKFAKLYASMRDRHSFFNFGTRRALPEEADTRRKKFLDKVFGGELRQDNETEFVEATDGRKIPLSALSSGQQELFPMWALLDYFTRMDAARSRGRSAEDLYQELVYIEEPEAHLFPSAQSLLMEFLIGTIASSSNRRGLIITTHSPYIMSKLNVFMKAGQLSRRKKVNTQIDQIVPRECWLERGDVVAYALGGGSLHRIIDEDDLIDGTYLDQISEDIAQEYSSLLALEAQI